MLKSYEEIEDESGVGHNSGAVPKGAKLPDPRFKAPKFTSLLSTINWCTKSRSR